MKKFIYWRYNLIIYSFIIAAFNYLLLQFPLTNVFGYEFAAFNAAFLSLLAGIHTLSLINGVTKENKWDKLHTLRINYVVFLSIPLLISIINSYFSGFCSFIDGLLFYLVLALPSVIVGGALAFISFRIFTGLRMVVFLIMYFLILLVAIGEIYLNHQVYIYNPIFGYFPGTIFDEGISVDVRLAAYRFLNLLFFSWISVVIANNILDSTFRRKIFPLIALVVGGIFFYFSSYFGFSTTTSRIQSELPYNVQSPKFVIHSSGKIPKQTLQYIALNCENYYNELSKYFKANTSLPINIYLFDSRQEQKEIFGSEYADVAKPWLNSVYTSLDNWESTLKHEIAHCFSAVFGTGLFKLAAGFNPALIEGVAEASDAFYDENYIHNLAAVAYNNGQRADIIELFSGISFFKKSSTLAYAYSGSFCKFLIERYGVNKFKELYASNDFKDTYNIQINQLIPAYYDFLASIQKQKQTEKANYYFGRQTIFEKICPRHISNELTKGWDYLNQGNAQKAIEVFEGILQMTKNYSAVVGKAESYEKLEMFKKSISTIEKSLAGFKETNYYYNLSFILANYYLKTGKLASADSIYSELEKLNLNYKIQTLSKMRSLLIQERMISDYMNGSSYDKYHILKRLNLTGYRFYTFPALLELSELLDENYSIFLQQFDINLIGNNEYSSYGLLKLSEYMMKNLDFDRARRIASLAVRFRSNAEQHHLLDANFKKASWLYENGSRILAELKFSSHN